MKKNRFLFFSILFLLSLVSSVQAANPVLKYFSRLFDETRAEIAIGELMKSQFAADVEGIKITPDQQLTDRMKKLAENSARTDLNYQVLIIDSDIPDEIPVPGGTLMITTGLLAAAVSEEQKDFILARNVAHMVLKHPMKLIKNEGIYPKILNQLKMVPEKRDKQQLRAILRDYLVNLPKMNHRKADLQGILLTSSPEKTRRAAISLLGSFSVKVWPVLPWDTSDLPMRTSDLEKLKLPE